MFVKLYSNMCFRGIWYVPWFGELCRPCCHVFLLWNGCTWTKVPEIPMVEKIRHHISVGRSTSVLSKEHTERDGNMYSLGGKRKHVFPWELMETCFPLRVNFTLLLCIKTIR